MKRTSVVPSLLLVTVLFATTATLWSTTVIPMPVERLAQISSHVLRGRAVESWSAWNQQHGLIYTYTRFEVQQTLKGQAPATIVVKQLGGTVNGTTQHVSGLHYWRSGEEAVLFLRQDERLDGTLVVTGLIQGNFMITRTPTGEALVSNGVHGASSYQVSGSQATHVSEFQGNHMTLRELESLVAKSTGKAVQQ